MEEKVLYSVIRDIHFCYGHRLVGHGGKCANLHGHNGKVQIEVCSEKLDSLNMVIDFQEIQETIGKWISENLDHKMILWKEDPVVPKLREAGEKFLEVDENPTAEFFAKWIYEECIRLKLPVKKVILWETNNSCATYEGK